MSWSDILPQPFPRSLALYEVLRRRTLILFSVLQSSALGYFFALLRYFFRLAPLLFEAAQLLFHRAQLLFRSGLTLFELGLTLFPDDK